MSANQLINLLAAEDKDGANDTFMSMIQDKVADALEVRKVEIASTIFDDLQEGKKLRASEKTHQVVYTVPGEGKQKQYFHVHADDEDHAREQLMDAEPKAKIHKVERINEGEGMDAQRRWTRQVAAVIKANPVQPHGKKASFHRGELKDRARKYFNQFGGVKGHGAEFVERGADAVRGARQTLKAQGKLPGLRKEETLDEGGPTRKHFQQVADLIKEIPDEAKRKELAQHHASIFKQQNPRFDHARFYKAAGVNEEVLDEVVQGGAVTNTQLNRNVLTNIRKAVQTLRVKGVNPTIAAAGHRDFGKLVSKNPKAPGYMLLRKLAPNKASAVQSLTQAGVPLGGALEANPNDFNQALQRIKRFK